ncbi:MAG: FAD-binding protein [Firmicutes bacterium]|nr:FAD-binding protein [Bacillota bacterium]
MISIKEYVAPKTLDEALKVLESSKKATIIGGGAFLKLGSINISKAIDLSKLNLDFIKEYDNKIEIGAMATFGDIERSKVLKKYFNNALGLSVKDIVGVQLRNMVTVGATVYSRYGFSDILTCLLSLDTKVSLKKQGEISLEKFLIEGSNKKDILEKIIISKDGRKASFKSMRNSKGDYAILNLSVSKKDDTYLIAVGARPNRATLAYETIKYLKGKHIDETVIKKACEIIEDEITFGSNIRANKEYRKGLSKVLLKRALTEVVNYEN